MKRVTVTIDEELDRKIRKMQVSLITSTQRGWIYSSVLTGLVEEGLESSTVKNLKPKTRAI